MQKRTLKVEEYPDGVLEQGMFPGGGVADPEEISLPVPPRKHGSGATAFSWRNLGRRSLFAIVFLLPFLFLPFTQFPVDAAKIAVTAILLIVGLVSFSACVVEERKIAYPRSWLALGVVVLVAVVALAARFSTSPSLSWYGKLFEPDSVLAFLAYAAAFFLAFYFLTDDDMPKLARLFFGGMAIATILNLLQAFNIFWLPWSFAKTNAFDTFDTAFGWGILMAASLVLAASAWLRGIARKRDRILLVLMAALMTFGLIVVNFETIWIGLAIVLLAVGTQFASRASFRTPFLFVALAICMAIIGPHIPSFASVAAEVRPDFPSSAIVAAHAAHGWRILVGSGPSTFGEQFTRFRSENLNQTNFWNFPFVQGYDFFATFFAATGILGLLAFLSVVLLFIRQAMRGKRGTHGNVLIVTLFAGLLALCFYAGFFVLMLYFFIALGLFLRDARAEGEISLDVLKPSVIFGIFAVVALFAACAVAAAFEIGTQYVAAAEYQDGATALAESNITAAAVSVQHSLALVPSSDDAWRTASDVALASGEQSFTASGGTLSSGAQAAVASAVQAAQEAVVIDPNNVLNWENLGNVYESLIPVANGADTLARAAYQNAEALDPWNPDLPVSIAQVDIAAATRFSVTSDAADAGQALTNAEAELNDSLSLKPGYATPLTLLAQIDLQAGNTTKAIQEVSQVASANPDDPGIAFQLGVLLYENNQMDAAQSEFEQAVSLEDDYSNARYFLGLIYANKGMTSAALAQFQAIAQENPGNAEIGQIIANLQAGEPALSGIGTASAPSSAVVPAAVSSTTTRKAK